MRSEVDEVVDEKVLDDSDDMAFGTLHGLYKTWHMDLFGIKKINHGRDDSVSMAVEIVQGRDPFRELFLIGRRDIVEYRIVFDKCLG